jgi:hypothetical protein
MRVHQVSLASVLGAGAVLAGCATPTPPAAVITYAGKACDSQPDLSRAISLVPQKPPKKNLPHVVTTEVNGQTRCLTRPGGNGPYLVYALEPDHRLKMHTIGAVQERARVLSPDVSILDREGRVTRVFGPGDFLFRGGFYSVQFRSRDSEAFVLFATNPGRVGERRDSIEIGTSTSGYYVAGFSGSYTLGVDNAATRTFSYEGTAQVVVYDSPADASP